MSRKGGGGIISVVCEAQASRPHLISFFAESFNLEWVPCDPGATTTIDWGRGGADIQRVKLPVSFVDRSSQPLSSHRGLGWCSPTPTFARSPTASSEGPGGDGAGRKPFHDEVPSSPWRPSSPLKQPWQQPRQPPPPPPAEEEWPSPIAKLSPGMRSSSESSPLHNVGGLEDRLADAEARAAEADELSNKWHTMYKDLKAKAKGAAGYSHELSPPGPQPDSSLRRMKELEAELESRRLHEEALIRTQQDREAEMAELVEQHQQEMAQLWEAHDKELAAQEAKLTAELRQKHGEEVARLQANEAELRRQQRSLGDTSLLQDELQLLKTRCSVSSEQIKALKEERDNAVSQERAARQELQQTLQEREALEGELRQAQEQMRALQGSGRPPSAAWPAPQDGELAALEQALDAALADASKMRGLNQKMAAKLTELKMERRRELDEERRKLEAAQEQIKQLETDAAQRPWLEENEAPVNHGLQNGDHPHAQQAELALELEALKSELAASEDARQLLQERLDERAAAGHELADMERRVATAQGEKREVEGAMSKLLADRESLLQAQATAHAELGSLRQQLRLAEEAAKQRDEETRAALAREEQLAELEKERSALRGRVADLTEAVRRSHEAMRESKHQIAQLQAAAKTGQGGRGRGGEVDEYRRRLNGMERLLAQEREDKRLAAEDTAVERRRAQQERERAESSRRQLEEQISRAESARSELIELEELLSKVIMGDPLNKGLKHVMKMTNMDDFECSACGLEGSDWAWKCCVRECPDRLHMLCAVMR